MRNYLIIKCQNYLLFLAVGMLLLTAVPFAINTQREGKSKVDIDSQEKSQVSVVSISNYPVKGGHLSSAYGMRKDPIHGKRRMHSGIDIAARSGTFVYPMGEGKVIFSGRKAGYGRTIEILHGNTVVSRYAHLKELLIDKGRKVEKDVIIGLVGRSGRSTGPHLHLEVALNGKVVDPQIFLMGDIASR